MSKLNLEALRLRPCAADGAWATALRARGWPLDAAVELANVEQPALVSALAAEYLAAGARFLTTNTFSANRLMLKRRRVGADATELSRNAAELVHAAAVAAAPESGRAWIAGSIGPSGRILAVHEATEAELRANVAEQAEALASGGADVLLLETFSELAELLIAVDEARRATALPIIASLSFDSGPQRTRTLMGAEAGACAAALTDAGADVIGCNCGSGISDVLPAVVALRANTNRPIWVKPNAGLPELEDGRPVWRQTAEDFAACVPQLVEAGACIIGGCCGTEPEHVRRVAALLAPPARTAAKSPASHKGR
jgi:methionine synthase I (cobalamin-dependent)